MSIASRPIRTTAKGLVTERHGLVFDPDATVDEQNCEVLVSQIRRRRKGVAYEDSYELSSFTQTVGEVSRSADWNNVGGAASLEFLVVQVGDTLYFYDKSTTPISSGIKSFSVDLTTFTATNSVVIATTPFQGATLNGVFVVAHPGCELFYIEYDIDADTISTTEINPTIRDFEWQGDNIEDYFTGIATASASVERKYDTKNAGWIDDGLNGITNPPLSTFITARGGYPQLTHPWYSGKDANGDFDSDEFLKIFAGTTLTGNGHYVLDFFAKNREQYETGAGIELESARFSAVAAFSGRFWYSGLQSQKNGGKVLFTRVIQNDQDYNRCYQANDPTAEDISDLLDNDGGEINIPEAYGIQKLFPIGSSLMVFATNGVWRISGVDDVFRATEYSISKVSGFGIATPGSFVDAGGIPFWWSTEGIHSVDTNNTTSLAEVNITRDTIQTFWDQIDDEKKLQVSGAYDRRNRKIYWGYPSNDETVDYKLNKFLILDLVNQAWFPWTIEDQETDTNYIIGFSYFPAYGAVAQTVNVTENGVQVTEEGVDVTVTSGVEITSADSQIKLVCRDGDTGKITIGLFGDADFVDWGEVNYSSYFTLGYDDFDTLALEKTGVYVVTFLELTEDGWTEVSEGSYTPTSPSGCTMEYFWNFRNTSPSTQNVYRLRNLPVPDQEEIGTFSYPTSVVINKTHIKGIGRVLQLKFSSENGKEFRFMGYEVIFDRHEQI